MNPTTINLARKLLKANAKQAKSIWREAKALGLTEELSRAYRMGLTRTID
jgi:hypothetical protein